ncbi:hypothetical protein [Kineosporia sp. NBRC 101731]|uniref:hypothetical protein n=1 Tax=Kineosporia sp. NBRC 101731 TaxID=3032199 RepID=UPI0024A0FD90|nr:hypothetical protein [Kineosporia sp. NBRC 101731]GLY30240.1 hypothetical protein Kisp02_36050 [Kineosporia sp. NBRC 101731]
MFDEKIGQTGTSPAMIKAAEDLVDRIEQVVWDVEYDDDGKDPVTSRVLLMREHLRRSAVWCTAIESHLPEGRVQRQWYFRDLAQLVAPGVRAEQATLDRFRAHWDGRFGGVHTINSIYQALHWSALSVAGDPRHDNVAHRLGPDADPYEPLLRFFERGGAYSLAGGGEIDIDFYTGFRAGQTEDILAHEPLYDLSQENLDRIDGFRWVAPGPSQPLVS